VFSVWVSVFILVGSKASSVMVCGPSTSHPVVHGHGEVVRV